MPLTLPTREQPHPNWFPGKDDMYFTGTTPCVSLVCLTSRVFILQLPGPTSSQQVCTPVGRCSSTLVVTRSANLVVSTRYAVTVLHCSHCTTPIQYICTVAITTTVSTILEMECTSSTTICGNQMELVD